MECANVGRSMGRRVLRLIYDMFVTRETEVAQHRLGDICRVNITNTDMVRAKSRVAKHVLGFGPDPLSTASPLAKDQAPKRCADQACPHKPCVRIFGGGA